MKSNYDKVIRLFNRKSLVDRDRYDGMRLYSINTIGASHAEESNDISCRTGDMNHIELVMGTLKVERKKSLSFGIFLHETGA